MRPDEIETLLAEGIAEAGNFPVFRFFLNDFSTRTQAIDVLWSRRTPLGELTAMWHQDRRDAPAHERDSTTSGVATLEAVLPRTRWNVAHSTDVDETPSATDRDSDSPAASFRRAVQGDGRSPA